MRNPPTQSPGLARGPDRPSSLLGTPMVLLGRYRIALCALLAIAIIAGCARQYHWYRCGCDCVNYNYCPPAPLPYTPYCSCPTPIANQYDVRAAEAASTTTVPVAEGGASYLDDLPGQ